VCVSNEFGAKYIGTDHRIIRFVKFNLRILDIVGHLLYDLFVDVQVGKVVSFFGTHPLLVASSYYDVLDLYVMEIPLPTIDFCQTSGARESHKVGRVVSEWSHNMLIYCYLLARSNYALQLIMNVSSTVVLF
jgi:hypothetical protein